MRKNVQTPFEEALDLCGFGTFNYLLILLCKIIVLAMVFETFAVSYLTSASACELKTSSVEQGLMAGMPLMGIIFTSHIWGFLADMKGRRKMLLVSLILGFIAGALSAFAPNWIVFSVLKMLSSSALSGTFPLSMTLLSECTPEAKRSFIVILASSIFVGAPAFMAVMTIPVLPLTFSYHIKFLGIYFNSWRLLSLIFTFPCALGAIGIYFSPESPKFLAIEGKNEESLKVLKRIFSINKRKSEDDYQVESLMVSTESKSKERHGIWSSIKQQTLPLIRPPLLKNTIILSTAIVVVYFSTNTYMMWLPSVADSFVRAVNREESAMSFCEMISGVQNETSKIYDEPACVFDSSAMMIVSATSLLYGGLSIVLTGAVNWFGRKQMIIFIQLTAAIAGFSINFVTGYALSASLFIIFLSPMVNIGLVTSFGCDVYPTFLRAMAVCLTMMVGRGSAVVGINILKQMLSSNCEESFYLFSSVCLGGAIVALFLPKDTRKKTPDIDTKTEA